jgi:Family of unknown function (DUF6580)
MLVYILIVFGFLLRLIPHAPNMVPIVAIALFAGANLNKKFAFLVPLAIMIASDLIIGMHDVIFFTWGAFLLIGALGMLLKKHKRPSTVFASSIIGALIFFVFTNFGVWLAWYPHTLEGLATCYVKAIPFFRNSLVTTVAFSFVLFGVFELAKNMAAKTRFKAVLLAD